MTERPQQGRQEAMTGLLDRLYVRGAADRQYVASLYGQYLERKAGEHSQGVPIIGENFSPSALLSEQERRTSLGVVDYATEVKGNTDYATIAQHTTVTMHPLDGGPGSSVRRDEYLASMASYVGREANPQRTSKGADLYFLVDVPGFDKNGNTKREQLYISTMELKMLRLLEQVQEGAFQRVNLRPIISEDGIPVLADFYGKTYLFDRVNQQQGFPQRSYSEVFRREKNIGEVHELVQAPLPSIDTETGRLTNKYPSSGSHGRPTAIALQEISEITHGDSLHARVFYNGDGPNNSVSPEMVGFALQEGAGIVMITTTKLPVDKKGGILGIESAQVDGQTHQVAQIMELAQAKTVGQEDLFYAVGLADQDAVKDMPTHQAGEQYFNTNTAILNETVLGPFLARLRKTIGEKEFAKAITPDLIENEKKDKGKTYTLLEGAMGSVLLNLARTVETNVKAKELWDEMSGGKQFLRIINVDPTHRDEFFTPTKYTIDYILQAGTNKYALAPGSFRLENTTPGHIPILNGDLTNPDGYYGDVANSLLALGQTKLNGLKELIIEGAEQGGGMVHMAGAILKGRIRIVSEYPDVYDLMSNESLRQLGATNKLLTLEDVTIYISPEGIIQTRPVAA